MTAFRIVILVDKLHPYGIGPNALSLLRSYLTDRRQLTYYNNTFSKQTLVKYGVPQGSVLGPLLFIIYINDLSPSILNSDVILFADDATLANSNIHFKVEMFWSKSDAEQWFQCHKLSLNKRRSYFFTENRKQYLKKPWILLSHSSDTPTSSPTKFQKCISSKKNLSAVTSFDKVMRASMPFLNPSCICHFVLGPQLPSRETV